MDWLPMLLTRRDFGFRAFIVNPDRPGEHVELVLVRGVDLMPGLGAQFHAFGPADVALPDRYVPLLTPKQLPYRVNVVFEVYTDAGGVHRFRRPYPLRFTSN